MVALEKSQVQMLGLGGSLLQMLALEESLLKALLLGLHGLGAGFGWSGQWLEV